MGTLQIGLVVGATLGSSVGSTFRSLDKNIMKLTKKTDFAMNGIKLGETFKTMRAEALKMSSQMQRGLLDDGGVRKFAQLREATRAASAEARKYGLDINNLNKQLSTMRTYQMHQQGFAQRAEMRALRRTERGSMMGELFTTVAMATATFGYPMRVGMAFEQSMAEVGAITRANSEDMELLTKSAKEMGKTTKFSASEAAQGQKFLAMAGFKTLQIMDAMPSMLDLAAASGMDLATTADIGSNILTGFKMKAEEITRVSNVLALAASSSNTDITQLGYAMKYTAPIARILGLSIEKTAAIIGKLSDAGIQGSMAGTSMRGMLDSLVDEKNMATLNTKFKVNVKDKKGNLRALDEILADLNVAMDKKGYTNLKKTSTIMDMFGVRAGTGALAIWESIISGELKALEEMLIKEQDDAAKEMARKMNDTVKGKFIELGSAFESVGIEIQGTYQDDLKGFLTDMSASVRATSSFIEKNKTLVKSVVAVSAGLMGLKIASLATRIGWSLLKDGGSHLMDVFQMLRPSVIKNSIEMAKLAGNGSFLKGIFSGLRGGIKSFAAGAMADLKAVGSAFKGLWAITAAHPFVAIGIAIVAVATLVYLYWEPIKAFAIKLWDNVKIAWSGFKAWCSALFTSVANEVISLFTSPFETIERWIGKIASLWHDFMSIFSNDITKFDAAKATKINTDAGAVRSVPQMATGGLVTKPTFSLVGERGPEVVVPIGSTFRERGRSLLDYAAGALGLSDSEATQNTRLEGMFRPRQQAQSGSGMTVNLTVNSAPGMNVQELAEEVMRRIKYAAGVAERSAYADASFFG